MSERMGWENCTLFLILNKGKTNIALPSEHGFWTTCPEVNKGIN